MCLRYLIWIGILLSEGLYSTGKFCESRTLYCANAAMQKKGCSITMTPI